MSTRPVNEDDLHAYVDGRLDADGARCVARYLDANPEAAARTRAWQAGGEMLRAALAAKAAEPVPSRLNLARLAETRQARAWAPARIAATLALALGMGGAFGWWARGSDVPHGLAGLGAEAALTQRVYATSGLVDFGPAAREQQLGFVGGAPVRAVQAPDLAGAGYRLLGGRLVPTAQGSATLFVYENAAGERISLFVRLMIGLDENASMRQVGSDGLAGFAWSRDGVGYSLISGAATPALRTLSDEVRRETERT